MESDFFGLVEGVKKLLFNVDLVWVDWSFFLDCNKAGFGVQVSGVELSSKTEENFLFNARAMKSPLFDGTEGTGFEVIKCPSFVLK